MEYVKQTFVPGQILTAQCLNNIEDGLYEACLTCPDLSTEGRAADAKATGEKIAFALQEIERAQEAAQDKVSKTGWSADKYLGTDAEGNVVEKDAPGGGGGLTEVSWEDIQNKPFYDESVTSQVSFDPLPTVTFDAMYTWWKCSDLVLTRAQILETTILTVFAPGTEFAEVPQETDIVVDEENFTGVLFASGSNAGYIFCRATGEHTVSFAGNPVTFTCPEMGVYLAYSVGQTPPTTISVDIGYKDVKTLDVKYLPMDAIDERIGAYIEEALGGDY